MPSPTLRSEVANQLHGGPPTIAHKSARSQKSSLIIAPKTLFVLIYRLMPSWREAGPSHTDVPIVGIRGPLPLRSGCGRRCVRCWLCAYASAWLAHPRKAAGSSTTLWRRASRRWRIRQWDRSACHGHRLTRTNGRCVQSCTWAEEPDDTMIFNWQMCALQGGFRRREHEQAYQHLCDARWQLQRAHAGALLKQAPRGGERRCYALACQWPWTCQHCHIARLTNLISAAG